MERLLRRVGYSGTLLILLIVCLPFLFSATDLFHHLFTSFSLGFVFFVSVQTSADADSDSGCGPTFQWERFNATGGGEINVPVLGFGTYVVSLKATDSVGNEAEIISQTASVKTKTTSPPRSLHREASSPTP